MRRKVLIAFSFLAVLIGGVLVVDFHNSRAGFPFTHRWRQTQLCESLSLNWRTGAVRGDGNKVSGASTKRVPQSPSFPFRHGFGVWMALSTGSL